MKRMTIIRVTILSLLVVFLLLPAVIEANGVDFEVVYIDPDWESEVFTTIGFRTAAIAFDDEDNLYVSKLIDDWGSGTGKIYRLEPPHYLEPTLFLSYQTTYPGINGMDFDRKGNLFVSEFMGSSSGFDAGSILRISASNHKVSEPIEFVGVPDDGKYIDFRPTGITVTDSGTIFFPGRKHSNWSWGNLYKIDSFKNYDPEIGPDVYKEGVVGTAIAVSKWGDLFVGSRYSDNGVYTVNPYTGQRVLIARFNKYVEELAFDSNGNLQALEGHDSALDTPTKIIKLTPPYVSINGCDTGIIDWPFEDYDTISDMIESCRDEAANHGQFVSCVVEDMVYLRQDGFISNKQMSAIVRCAAKAGK